MAPPAQRDEEQKRPLDDGDEIIEPLVPDDKAWQAVQRTPRP